MKLPLIRNMRSEVGNILVVSSSQFTCYISYPGQLKIKYPDVTGDFIFVDLVKGGTGLGKFKIGGCKFSRRACLLFCACFLTSLNSHQSVCGAGHILRFVQFPLDFSLV